jgi:hypothetical protein
MPGSSCSNSNNVPVIWLDHMKGYESGEACCDGYFGEGIPCEIVDKCKGQEETGTISTAAVSNLDVAGCSEGFCENFDGVCQPEISCFVDPCASKECENGQVCESNYCGGCHAKCVDNDMVQNSATVSAATSDCPLGECHNPDGVCETEMSCAVDPCNGHPCAFTDICQTNMCGGCHAVCAPDPMYVDIQQASGSGTGESTDVVATVATATEAPQSTVTTVETTIVAATTTAAEATGSKAGKGSKATVNAAPAMEYEDATTEAPQASPTMQETNTEATTTEAPQTTTSTEETSTESSPLPVKDESDPLASYPFIDISEEGLFDSFDDLGNSDPMPWIFGNPKKWIRDDTHTLHGAGALRNAAPPSEEVSYDLSLKIRTTKYFAIKCYAYVDIAMPYDYITLEVNGELREAKYIARTEWIQIAAGLRPGENVITFTVKKPEGHYPDAERIRGSGYVWLDICELMPFS